MDKQYKIETNGNVYSIVVEEAETDISQIQNNVENLQKNIPWLQDTKTAILYAIQKRISTIAYNQGLNYITECKVLKNIYDNIKTNKITIVENNNIEE